jgi:hypothetical protein
LVRWCCPLLTNSILKSDAAKGSVYLGRTAPRNACKVQPRPFFLDRKVAVPYKGTKKPCYKWEREQRAERAMNYTPQDVRAGIAGPVLSLLRRRLVSRGIPGFLLAVALLGGLAWYFSQGLSPNLRENRPSAADEALRRRLLQAVVAVVPDRGTDGGYGVLIDQKNRLVVTVSPVVGKRSEVHVRFLIDPFQGRAPSAGLPDPGIGRVVSTEECTRGLILLRLDYLPEEASALAVGDWSPLPNRVLHSFTRQEADSLAADEALCTHRQGSIGMVLQIPHY